MEPKIFPEYFFSFFFAEVNKKFPGQADFIGSVGKGEANNILILV
jgi:hypothetical protein